MKRINCDKCGKPTGHTISDEQKNNLNLVLYCDDCESKETTTPKKTKQSLKKEDIIGIIFGISIAWAIGFIGLVPYIIGIIVGTFIVRKMLGSKKLSINITFWILFVLIFIWGTANRGMNSESEYSPSQETRDAYFLETNNNSVPTEFSEDMYQNTRYGFRIKFPKGWNITPGDEIQVAENNGDSISVGITELPYETRATIKKITDITTSSDYNLNSFNDIKQNFPDVKFIDSGETKIDNQPTYWLKYSLNLNNIDTTFSSYQLIKNNYMFTIGVTTHTNSNSDIKSQITKSINTFIFDK